QNASDIEKRRAELEAQLAENKEAQLWLRHELEAAQKQLQAQHQNSSTEQTTLQARIKELEAAHAAVEQKVTTLSESWAGETRGRESSEQNAGDIEKRRAGLESELARNTETQAQLRRDLEALQEQLRAQQQSSSVEQTTLQSRIKELETAHSSVEQ